MVKVARWAGGITLSGLVAALALEGLSALYVLAGFGRTPHRPVYAQTAPTLSEILYEGESWGAWHLPNARALLWSRCYQAEYSTNSRGMRDRERALSSRSLRIVVLGDSYVEGFGVDVERRVTNLLEKQFGVEVLNFGASGNLGILSYLLIYEEIVSHFKHDIVLVFVSAMNDFVDHDPRFWEDEEGTLPQRYRPYWKQEEAGFAIWYPLDQPAERKILAIHAGTKHPLASFVKNWTWTGGLLRDLNYAKSSADLAHRLTATGGPTGYAEENPVRLAAARYFLEQLAAKVGTHRRLMIIVHPSLEDIGYLQSGGVRLTSKIKLKEAENLAVLDIGPMFAAEMNPSGLYFSCDGHWSERGNQVVARVVGEELTRRGWTMHVPSADGWFDSDVRSE